ncbi:MAG: hypothetical protein BWY72_02209 [Bacteroidetes bacterium ADurb.Bin416]|nr:MAG: hypothetical protein BWY72_02209 [Bacteroidetes bacterium ADurb.Bin416]
MRSDGNAVPNGGGFRHGIIDVIGDQWVTNGDNGLDVGSIVAVNKVLFGEQMGGRNDDSPQFM